MKIFLRILIGVLLIGLIVFFVYLSNNSSNNRCESLIIKTLYQEYPLYPESAINADILKEYGELKGEIMKDIELEQIKNIIQKNPYVKHATVYKEAGNRVIAEVDIIKPLFKLYTNDENIYVVDDEGTIIKMNNVIPMRILIANGDFSIDTMKNIYDISKVSNQNSHILLGMYNIAKEIQKDEVYSELVAQIYYEGQSNYELTPVFGDFVIQIGSADNLEKKLERLSIVYSHIIPYYDTKKYSAINVAIENQIVCTKF